MDKQQILNELLKRREELRTEAKAIDAMIEAAGGPKAPATAQFVPFIPLPIPPAPYIDPTTQRPWPTILPPGPIVGGEHDATARLLRGIGVGESVVWTGQTFGPLTTSAAPSLPFATAPVVVNAPGCASSVH
jgi:hypothetical protein